MQNIKNHQDNMSNFNNNHLKKDNNFSKNIDLMSIIKKIDFSKKQLKTNKKNRKNNNKNKKIFNKMIFKFINNKKEKYENEYKTYYIDKDLNDVGKSYIYERYSNFEEFVEKMKNIETLKKHLNNYEEIKNNIIEEYKDILYIIKENKSDDIEEIKNKN